MSVQHILSFFLCLLSFSGTRAQPALSPVPSVYHTIRVEEGLYYLDFQGRKAFEVDRPARYTLSQMTGLPTGSENGLEFNFGRGFSGRLYYGFIPYGDSKHPHPVYFRNASSIIDGVASINIRQNLSGVYDMVGWQQKQKGTLGYRVVDSTGLMVYDGIVSFKGAGPFAIDYTLTEGPFVNRLKPDGATISFTTNLEVTAEVIVDGKRFAGPMASTRHEIPVTGLSPATTYTYSVRYGDSEQTYTFQTAPTPGSRQEFVFAYASDSRSGQGGGERNLFGANFYIMKKILALCRMKDAAFLQFSGDLIDGYLTSTDETDLQYANWKRAIQPFAHYFPVYVSMGNHEALVRLFRDSLTNKLFQIDRFPFETESAEAVFAANFSNPDNGPESEDGSVYDPDPNQIDFPSYQENVFYYTYDNIAVIVLNSDYFYAPTSMDIRFTGGGLHGYIMDRQLEWLEQTVDVLEADPAIDHIFVTQHTPCFPNGGHTRDDMWYSGNNQMRPFVAGRPLIKGIIERRDQILDLLVNKSRKTIAILTGDEHNYNRLEITPQTPIYPEPYFFSKIELSRTIYQINNGAAGAPYYAQEQVPWTPYVSGFTTQNAVVFFRVNGKSIRMEVLNPDTLEIVDQFQLR